MFWDVQEEFLHPAVLGPAPLLLRHASQSSLDESSQKLAGRQGGEPRRPPYRNSQPTSVAKAGWKIPAN